MQTPEQSCMAILSRPSQWNSQAVLLLRKGDIQGGIAILKRVLYCLRNELVAVDNSHSQLYSSGIDASMEDQDDARQPSIIRSVRMGLVSNSAWSSDHNLLSLYSRTFVYQDEAAVNSSHFQMSVVVLYNLAFAYQMDAERKMQDGRNSRSSLEAAKGFYKSAMEITSSCWDDNDFHSAEWFALAILNNLGFIASQEMDFCNTQYSIGMILDFLSIPSENLLNAIPEDDIDLFYLSVYTYFDGNELCTAPAA